MIRLRVKERASLTQIAKLVGVGRTTASRQLKDYPLTPEEQGARWREQMAGRVRFQDGTIRPGPDLAGQKFGRLTVVSRVLTEKRNTRWLCQCECGVFKVVTTGHLSNSTTRSCGCLARDMSRLREQKDPALVNMNYLIGHYKRSAAMRFLEFSLNNDECAELFSGTCHYCGVLPFGSVACHKNPLGEGRQYKLLYNGIDRIDSEFGYTAENCVSCCKICNYAKRDMSYDDFLAWVNLIASYRFNVIRQPFVAAISDKLSA